MSILDIFFSAFFFSLQYLAVIAGALSAVLLVFGAGWALSWSIWKLCRRALSEQEK
jgi:hypothetical protein